MGQHFRNSDFKHDYSATSSSYRQYNFHYRSNSYPLHPNPSQSWKPYHETETVDYCLGCSEQRHWKWACPIRKQSLYLFYRGTYWKLRGKTKNRGIWRICRLHFGENQPQKTPSFLEKYNKSKQNSVWHS